MKYFIDKKGCYYNLLVWCKSNSTPLGNSPFLSDLEYCLCFYEKGCLFNKGCDLKRKFYISGTNQSDKKLYEHPTIKPLDLVKRHILLSTNENDIVLDPFIGSGTTAVACKETGRQYIGFEIDKHYHEIAVDRLKGITQENIKKGQLSLFDFL